MKPVKPSKFWILINPFRYPLRAYLHATRMQVIQDAERDFQLPWKEIRKRGFTVEKVVIQKA